jgi:hypothetical protein
MHSFLYAVLFSRDTDDPRTDKNLCREISDCIKKLDWRRVGACMAAVSFTQNRQNGQTYIRWSSLLQCRAVVLELAQHFVD